jgi:hypothetical protein
MIPISEAYPMAKFLKFIRKLRVPLCSICNKPVEVEAATIDEHGEAIHEECWLLKMRLEQAKKPPKTLHGPGQRKNPFLEF